jgi:hypothetical protein
MESEEKKLNFLAFSSSPVDATKMPCGCEKFATKVLYFCV